MAHVVKKPKLLPGGRFFPPQDMQFDCTLCELRTEYEWEDIQEKTEKDWLGSDMTLTWVDCAGCGSPRPIEIEEED